MHVARVAYFFVGLLLALLAPFFFMATPRGRARLWERYGFWKRLPAGEFAWFHAASMGEMGGVKPIIAEYQTRNPEMQVLVTATSVTALAGMQGYECRLLPFDNILFIAAALRGRLPRFCALSENEIWPELIRYLAHRQVPVFLVNARISARSCRRLYRYRWFFSEVFSRIKAVAAVHKNAAARLEELGVQRDRIEITGNAKYDRTPKNFEPEALRSTFFSQSAPVFCLGCLRPGEEQIWFPLIAEWQSTGRALNFIIAPRHQEKFDFFSRRLDEFGVKFKRRSESTSLPISSGVVLLDTLGELEGIYTFSQAAFIGGTLLAEYGGHNPFEAACCKSLPILGPFGVNIAEIREELLAAEATVVVETAGDARKLLELLSTNAEHVSQQAERAYQVWRKHAGAARRIVDQLMREMS